MTDAEHHVWYEHERRFAAWAVALNKAMGGDCYWAARGDIATWRQQYGDEGAYKQIVRTILTVQMTQN